MFSKNVKMSKVKMTRQRENTHSQKCNCHNNTNENFKPRINICQGFSTSWHFDEDAKNALIQQN